MQTLWAACAAAMACAPCRKVAGVLRYGNAAIFVDRFRAARAVCGPLRLLRSPGAVAVLIACAICCGAGAHHAFAQVHSSATSTVVSDKAWNGKFVEPSYSLPDSEPAAPPEGWYEAPQQFAAESFDQSFEARGVQVGDVFDDSHPPGYYLPSISWLGMRHSHTHGRHVGFGGPYTGTSWLNRPYYVGGELGTLWMTRGVDDSIGRDVDMFGGVFAGWNWDHYWGNEVRFNRATPEMINAERPDAKRNDRLMMWSYSFLYYPWGDAMLRPYWRWGIGNTKIDFPLDHGGRHDEWLLTFPIGVGVKYPLQRWLAARAEFTDQLSLGSNGIPTQHNLTLTFGLEWHFGARPKSYWPWYPSRYIW